MKEIFYLIINPNAGTHKFKKYWKLIQKQLDFHGLQYHYVFTSYAQHERNLAAEAIKKGYKKIIAVGGDGTLHQIVNGVFIQDYVATREIQLGVIPMGTGNDWIKTYNIPNSIEKSIALLKEENLLYQDIGRIQSKSGEAYYINMAGIGYDGYVVKTLNSLKIFGSIAYLLSGLYGLFSYRKSKYIIDVNDQILKEKCLMILFGICQYSGGGMQMTKDSNPKDGLLDITLVKNFSFLDLLWNIPKLYSGKITDHPKVLHLKSNYIHIQDVSKKSFIEADGELIEQGDLTVHILPSSIQIFTKS